MRLSWASGALRGRAGGSAAATVAEAAKRRRAIVLMAAVSATATFARLSLMRRYVGGPVSPTAAHGSAPPARHSISGSSRSASGRAAGDDVEGRRPGAHGGSHRPDVPLSVRAQRVEGNAPAGPLPAEVERQLRDLPALFCAPLPDATIARLAERVRRSGYRVDVLGAFPEGLGFREHFEWVPEWALRASPSGTPPLPPGPPASPGGRRRSGAASSVPGGRTPGTPRASPGR
jgi:hypothetical protein